MVSLSKGRYHTTEKGVIGTVPSVNLIADKVKCLAIISSCDFKKLEVLHSNGFCLPAFDQYVICDVLLYKNLCQFFLLVQSTFC